MGIAVFDLDNTLIAGDSDYLWGRFLVEEGLVDAANYERENQRFLEDYEAGRLDLDAFLRFQLRILTEHDLPTLHRWRNRFLDRHIRPILLPAARALVQEHVDRGHTPLIITATNRFITEPIARELAIPHLIATEPELREDRYTGRVVGTPSFREGKVRCFDEWCLAQRVKDEESWFYSDSHNDLPLLERVDHPVAVDPDPVLAQEAETRSWPIISLRETAA